MNELQLPLTQKILKETSQKFNYSIHLKIEKKEIWFFTYAYTDGKTMEKSKTMMITKG